MLYNYRTDKKNRRRPRHSIVFWYYPTQSRTGNPMTSITSMAKCGSYPSGSSADVTTPWRRHQIGLPFLIFPLIFLILRYSSAIQCFTECVRSVGFSLVPDATNGNYSKGKNLSHVLVTVYLLAEVWFLIYQIRLLSNL